MQVKIVKTDNSVLTPQYADKGSSCVDLRSNENKIIKPNEICLVNTGIKMAIPLGYEGQVRSRSGLALKHGISVLNSPGTIDSSYRGEIGVLLRNESYKEFCVNVGDRIAQLAIVPVIIADFVEVDSLEETERGEGGWGHTGIK